MGADIVLSRSQSDTLFRERRAFRHELSRFQAIIKRLLSVFLILCVVVLTAFAIESPDGIPQLSFLLQLTVIASFGWAGFRIFRMHPILLVLPITYFFVHSAAFLGFGPLQILIYADAMTPTFGYRQLLEVQGQNIVGLFFVLSGILLASQFLRAATLRVLDPATRRKSDSRPGSIKEMLRQNRQLVRQVTLAYRLLATAAFLLYIAKWFFGVNVAALLPGFLNVVNSSGSVAIVIGAILVSHKSSLVRWFFLFLLVGVESAAGALELMRGAAMMPWLFFILGLIIYSGRYMYAVAGLLIVVVIYPVLTPHFKAGRAEVWHSQAGTPYQFWSQRFSGGGGEVFSPQQSQGFGREDGWNPLHRFDVSPIQHGLIVLYDRGEPGSTFGQLHWLFLPRFLFPEKPVINFATEVTWVLFGHSSSSTGSTIFGEAYWNGGWIFVVLSAIFFGFSIYGVSVLVLKLLLDANAFGWLIAMVGWNLGASIGNLFTAGFLGPMIVFLGLFIIYRTVRRLV